MKKFLRLLGISILALVLGAGCFFGWLLYDFHQSAQADFWSTDSPPDATMRAELEERGYPSTISRVVRHGVSSRFNGDGNDLTVYCFPPTEVSRMKQLINERQADWVNGLPPPGSWKSHLREHTPKDLSIDETGDGRDYIHIHREPHEFGCTIIDTRRGISYDYRVRT